MAIFSVKYELSIFLKNTPGKVPIAFCPIEINSKLEIEEDICE